MTRRRRRRASLGEPTKKDFIAAAGIFCAHKASPALVDDFVSYFRRQNPRFDAERFKRAARCGK